MIASMPSSTLVTCEASASGGRRAAARETRSRTSLAAASRSRSIENSTVMRENSSRLDEVSFSTPSMPATSSSSTWVTRDSITAALAPR